MSAKEVAAPRHSPHVDCPVVTKPLAEQQRVCIREANILSRGILEWLETRTREEKAAWVQTSVGAGRVIFQPWAMEILFVLAVVGKARFGELQAMLRISSRTLSDKLQSLRDAGLIDRTVFDEQPVRIEYTLTKQGGKTASLATPLFTLLNQG